MPVAEATKKRSSPDPWDVPARFVNPEPIVHSKNVNLLLYARAYMWFHRVADFRDTESLLLYKTKNPQIHSLTTLSNNPNVDRTGKRACSPCSCERGIGESRKWFFRRGYTIRDRRITKHPPSVAWENVEEAQKGDCRIPVGHALDSSAV